MPDSEGWWRCLLHGKQGLAPANRLQILTEAPGDPPCPPLSCTPPGSEEAYQVPASPRSSPPGPIYEPMRSWVEPPTAQVYEFPDLPSRARIICEKTLTFPQQVSVPRKGRKDREGRGTGPPSLLCTAGHCCPSDPCAVGLPRMDSQGGQLVHLALTLGTTVPTWLRDTLRAEWICV